MEKESKTRRRLLKSRIVRALWPWLLAVCVLVSAAGFAGTWARAEAETARTLAQIALEGCSRFYTWQRDQEGALIFEAAGLAELGGAEGGYAFLADADGRILAHPDPAYEQGEDGGVALDSLGEDCEPLADMLRRGDTEGRVCLRHADGERYFYACTALPEEDWYLVAVCPAAPETGRLARGAARALLAAAAAAGTLLLCWRGIWRRYLQPVSRAVEAVHHAAAGDLSEAVGSIPRTSREAELLLEAVEGMRERNTACLMEMERVLSCMAEGDLTARLSCGRAKECAGVCGAMDAVAQRLRGAIGGVRSSLDQLAGQFDDLERDAAALLQNGEAQRREQDALERSLRQVCGQSGRRSQDARETQELAEEVCRRIASYDRQLGELSRAVERAGAYAAEAGRISRVMEDGASRCSVLARTAYIEAAKAGVDGKGFAVVASELRILASRSAQSARDAAVLLGELDRAARESASLSAAAARDFQSMTGRGEALCRRSAAAAAEEGAEAAEEAARQAKRLGEAAAEGRSLAAGSAEAGRRLHRRVENLREALRAFRLN